MARKKATKTSGRKTTKKTASKRRASSRKPSRKPQANSTYLDRALHHVRAYVRSFDWPNEVSVPWRPRGASGTAKDTDQDRRVAEAAELLWRQLWTLERLDTKEAPVAPPEWPDYRTHKERLVSPARTLLPRAAEAERAKPATKKLDTLFADLVDSCDEKDLSKLAELAREEGADAAWLYGKAMQWSALSEMDHPVIASITRSAALGASPTKPRSLFLADRFIAQAELLALNEELGDGDEVWPCDIGTTDQDVLRHALIRHEREPHSFDEDPEGVRTLATAMSRTLQILRREPAKHQGLCDLVWAVEAHLTGFLTCKWAKGLAESLSSLLSTGRPTPESHRPDEDHWTETYRWWEALAENRLLAEKCSPGPSLANLPSHPILKELSPKPSNRFGTHADRCMLRLLNARLDGLSGQTLIDEGIARTRDPWNAVQGAYNAIRSKWKNASPWLYQVKPRKDRPAKLCLRDQPRASSESAKKESI